MAHLPGEVHRLFAQQHGVVATAQLLEFVTSDQIERFEMHGTIVGFLRGVYRSPSWPLDELSRCAGVCLGRPYVAIAGPTAGRIWRYRRLPDDQRIHVVAPPGRKPVAASWVIAYRTAAIREVDVVDRSDGIRVTSRARTALDLARSVHPDDLLSIIEQAMHDGHVSEEEMVSVAVDFVSPKRPWLTTYLRQFVRRARGAPAESHPEVRVFTALAAAGVAGLVRQFPIRLPGFGNARFDLAVPELRWAIEVDVHPRHAETGGALSDRRRDEAALAVGWSTSRISREQYEHGLDARIRDLVGVYRNLRRAA